MLRNSFAKFHRGVVTRVTQGKFLRVDFTGNSEEHNGKEQWQQYGFASHALKGMELLFFRLFGWVVVTHTEDREHRPPLADGEVCLYTAEGDSIILKNGRIIEVFAGTKVKITAPTVEIIASVKVLLTTPLVDISQDVKIAGKLDVTGVSTFAATVDVTGVVTATAGVAAPGGVTAAAGIPSAGTMADSAGTMAAIRTRYNTHTHPENGTGGGTTSAPNQTF